jgi:hypothetical protein
MRRVQLLSVLVLGWTTSALEPARLWAQQPAAPGQQAMAAARALSGARAETFTMIQGNALTSANGALPDGIIRLRDARYGRIVDTTVTDKTGLFSFRGVDPGSYVVELIGADQRILAASQIININAGEAVSAIVKLPFRVPPFAGLLGHTTLSAVAVTTTAALSGVLVTEVAGEPASPRR